MAKNQNVDANDGYELVQNNWIKFSVIGNHILGTLVAVREMNSQLKPGEKTKIYEFKADGGEFNDTKDKKVIPEPVKILPGEFWNVGGGFGLDAALRNVKVGQKLMIKFTDEKPNKDKMKNPTKIKSVYVKKDGHGQPVFDQEWLDAQKEATEGAGFSKKAAEDTF